MRSIRILLALAIVLLAVRFSRADKTTNSAQESSTASSVVTRLAELDQLPEESWKYHAGDLAHAESPTLSDASWPTAEKGQTSSKEALWYRQWVEIPKNLHGYDLSGARVWFHFKAGSDVPQIIYLNGRRVALGEDMEPVVLFENAHPGDRVLVAVKLLATEHKKVFSGSTMRIDFSESRPNPSDFRQELLSAQRLLGTETREGKTLEEAAGAVDLQSLQNGDQARFDASLRRAEALLEPLKPALQATHFTLAGNSHIDAAWLWPWTETVDVVRRTFGTALQLMNEYPQYTYTQSSAVYNDWIAQKYPDLDRQIRQRIREGRWEIVGGMWVEPDLNMPDGESTARSILIAKRWYMQHYGIDVKIGWNPDSFGYYWQLPQIYKKSGIDYFVTQKMGWNDTNQLPLNLFWWQSPDGSKVLTYFPRGYSSRDLAPARLSDDMQHARKSLPQMPELMDMYGVGDHGGGPTRAMLDEGEHWMTRGSVIPEIHFGTAQSFFSSIEKKLDSKSPEWNYASIAKGFQPPVAVREGQVAIPTWNDELYLEFHRGVFTTQAVLKRNMRQAPVWTLNAEKFSSLAWLQDSAFDYPANELTDAWKTITFNDFHDLAAGSGIGAIYRDSQSEFEQVHRATDAISSRALTALSSEIDTRPAVALRGVSVPVLLFNPLAWHRSEVVTADVQLPAQSESVAVVDANGRTVPSEILSRDIQNNRLRLLISARNLPSLGYEVLQVIPQKRSYTSDLHANGTVLENAHLRVTIDPVTGCITSLYEKQKGFESLVPGSCGNELQIFKDKPKEYDAWNIDPGTLDQAPARLTKADSVKLIESSPLRAIVQVRRSWQHSTFVQNIELAAESDRVIVDNDIDWAETHQLLKAAFTLTATNSYATYEIPYGSIERPTTRQNAWEKARFEVPALRWADLGNSDHGFSLLNDAKYGYDAVGNVLRLTLLRSPTSPDPDADRGQHHFRYELYPHAGDWRQAMTVQYGQDLNTNIIAEPVTVHPGPMPASKSYVSVSGAQVVLTAMKKAEDGQSIVFHLYEWAGKDGQLHLQLPEGATSASLVNLLEQSQGSPLPLRENSVTIPVHPYEIVAVRVDYPRNAKTASRAEK